MNPVAAEAPAGSHQVLATKKYVLTRGISQIKIINARPIRQYPQVPNDVKGFPHGLCSVPQRKPKSAASVSQGHSPNASCWVKKLRPTFDLNDPLFFDSALRYEFNGET